VVVSVAGRGEFVRRARSRLRLPGRSLEFAPAEPAGGDATTPVRLDDLERRATG
jgi:hypothetical protein